MKQKQILLLIALLLSGMNLLTAKTHDEPIKIGEAQIATFDDLALDAESFWQGYENEEESVFYSGSYSFTNTYYSEWNFWGGFAYSNLTATTYLNQSEHQFRSVVGHGVDNSENYAVVYALGVQADIQLTYTTEADTVQGVYLTNNAWTYSSMTEGDSYAGEPFAQGDFYKVIFTGVHADNSTSSVECYLADYRSTNSDEHYILTDWKWFDLSSLGRVKKISVSLDGSRTGNFGLNSPGFFCMDNFGAKQPEATDIKDVNQPHSIIYADANTLFINTNYANYDVRIYSVTGMLLHSQKAATNVEINIGKLAKNVYIVELTSKNIREVQKFIKK
jgi:hypothetical protein